MQHPWSPLPSLQNLLLYDACPLKLEQAGAYLEACALCGTHINFETELIIGFQDIYYTSAPGKPTRLTDSQNAGVFVPADELIEQGRVGCVHEKDVGGRGAAVVFVGIHLDISALDPFCCEVVKGITENRHIDNSYAKGFIPVVEGSFRPVDKYSKVVNKTGFYAIFDSNVRFSGVKTAGNDRQQEQQDYAGCCRFLQICSFVQYG